MLSDSGILSLIEDGVLVDADTARVGSVSYDLRTQGYYQAAGARTDSVALKPGESAFVASVESVRLPGDVSASIALKNSRIRQGLAIASPVYFPGHATRLFYRVTNVSAAEIELDRHDEIAQVLFERVDGGSEKPYSGTFQDELDFKGMASYTDIYAGQMREVERKAEAVEAMEQRIYGNVVAIMGVFVAIFSLVNANLGWTTSTMPISSLVILDLTVVGGMAALIGLLAALLGRDGRLARYLPWAVALVSFAVAALLLATA